MDRASIRRAAYAELMEFRKVPLYDRGTVERARFKRLLELKRLEHEDEVLIDARTTTTSDVWVTARLHLTTERLAILQELDGDVIAAGNLIVRANYSEEIELCTGVQTLLARRAKRFVDDWAHRALSS
jgi:hypothetical protein